MTREEYALNYQKQLYVISLKRRIMEQEATLNEYADTICAQVKRIEELEAPKNCVGCAYLNVHFKENETDWCMLCARTYAGQFEDHYKGE